MTADNFNRILTQYDKIQSRNEFLLSQREAEINEKLPMYRELSNQIVTISMERSRALIQKRDTSDLSVYRQEVKAISQQKKELLVANGYAGDYLDKIYDCKDCKDTAYLPNNNKCHCLKERIFKALIEESTLTSRFSTDSFNTFDYDFYHSHQNSEQDHKNLQLIHKIVNDCKDFVASFDRTYNNLLLTGHVGVGKTFLSNCIAQELLKRRKSIVYFSAQDFFNQLSSIAFDNGLPPTVKRQLRDQIFRCDLLIIDDLGTELTNAFVESQLFACINERTLLKKPVIISTNLNLEQINDLYKNRIYSRIAGEYKLYELPGNDIRIQKKLQSTHTTEGM